MVLIHREIVVGELQDRKVVITGAASGLGEACVERCRAAGARVLALDVNEARGLELAETGGHDFMALDVSDREAWQRIADSLAGSGGVDHLHLNAGIQIAPPDAPLSAYRFRSLNLDRYRAMMGVNVDGVVYGLHAMLPVMNAGGSIVVTGSLAGVVPYHIDPLYSMSKHAITGLVRSLRQELGEMGLRINALCPGGIDTGIIPNEQRAGDVALMDPRHVADEVIRLLLVEDSGSTWAKVSEDKPAWVMDPPGRKRQD